MKKFNGYLLVAPLFLGCLIFYIIPFFMVIGYSFTIGYGKSAEFAGLENYSDLLSNDIFLLAFGNTMRFLAIALPLIIVISYIIAILLKESASKNQFFKSIFLLPYIMPVAGVVLIVELVFASNGMINEALYTLGLPIKDWLYSDSSFWVVMAVYIWKNTGYSTIILISGLVTIPQEHYDAASIDGASHLQKFFYVTNPQMWSTVFLAVVFSLINAFKCFREIFLIGGTHPHDSIYMLQHFINNTFENMNYFKLSTASVFLFLVILAVFLVFYIFISKKDLS